MTRFSAIQNNFSSGELSPKLEGRTDIEGMYRNGLSKCLNAIPNNIGGIDRRPGSVFVKDITSLGSGAGAFELNFSLTSSNVKSRLIPFEFENGFTYLFYFSKIIIFIMYFI
jgi:hypothetical protein